LKFDIYCIGCVGCGCVNNCRLRCDGCFNPLEFMASQNIRYTAGYFSFNFLIGFFAAGIQKEMMTHKDSRNKHVNEVLQGIRVIKFFAW